MIVQKASNLCVICGEQIPEGKQYCPICGASEGDYFQKIMSRKMDITNPEPFTVKDELEQAYRQGFEAGMKNACGLKQECERLKREVTVLRSQIESRNRGDDIDSEYE